MANKQVMVNCYDLTFDGKGVVKYQDKIGFIDNLLPEEELIEITYKKRKIVSRLYINDSLSLFRHDNKKTVSQNFVTRFFTIKIS